MTKRGVCLTKYHKLDMGKEHKSTVVFEGKIDLILNNVKPVVFYFLQYTGNYTLILVIYLYLFMCYMNCLCT